MDMLYSIAHVLLTEAHVTSAATFHHAHMIHHEQIYH